MTWRPGEHPAVAMPLGGIGTGSVALGVDGGYRQFQLLNVGNHQGDLPGTFLALRTSVHEPIHDQTVILQELRRDTGASGIPATPMVDDDLVPAWQSELVAAVGGTTATMTGTYPIAEVRHETGGPLVATVRATSPMVPTDLAASGIPGILVDVELHNPTDDVVNAWLAHSAHNPVGLDPHVNPRGVRAPGYGGNTNTLRRRGSDGRRALLVMDNPSVAPTEPSAGQLALGCEADAVYAFPCFEEPQELIEVLSVLAPYGDHSRLRVPGTQIPQLSAPAARFGPSASGSTWLGALIAHLTVAPGQSKRVRFVLAWHFPNRMVDFVQFGPDRPELGGTRFWLGNHYATQWSDAVDVADALLDGWTQRWEETRRWTDAIDDLSLPELWRTHVAAQPVPLRTPTTFRTADGSCFGFEGVLGASTRMVGRRGRFLPLNCTHVWNYAQAASAVFPAFEASMREIELDVMQAPSGAIAHRVFMPTYLEQFGDGPIGGPEHSALDGMCGTVLKTYRELRRGAIDLAWVERRWAKICRLMDHIAQTWDPQDTGLLSGIQPSTHDIGLHGTNTFMGTFWLAALRAAEELARLLGDGGRADGWRGRFERSSAALDEACFDGDYYVQRPDPTLSDDHQWGLGCLSDQLIGQWWAHELDLGHLLPADHVRSALRAVIRHNLRDDPVTTTQRPFAAPGERGLVVCSWPRGSRPAKPTLYCDEVWTGVEYQVAAHCLREGLVDEATQILEALWARHDGRRRNPFNEVECGDHYVRAMAGWSVLEARLGLSWNQLDATLRVEGPGRVPILTGTGWGQAVIDGEGARARVHAGSVALRRIVAGGTCSSWAKSCSRVAGWVALAKES